MCLFLILYSIYFHANPANGAHSIFKHFFHCWFRVVINFFLFCKYKEKTQSSKWVKNTRTFNVRLLMNLENWSVFFAKVSHLLKLFNCEEKSFNQFIKDAENLEAFYTNLASAMLTQWSLQLNICNMMTVEHRLRENLDEQHRSCIWSVT